MIGVVGQISLGHVSDRIGREWIWGISMLGFVICFLALIVLQHDPSMLWLYLMVAAQGGLGYGLSITVMGAMVAEIFQGRHFGGIFGTVMLSAIVGRRRRRTVGDRRIARHTLKATMFWHSGLAPVSASCRHWRSGSSVTEGKCAPWPEDSASPDGIALATCWIRLQSVAEPRQDSSGMNVRFDWNFTPIAAEESGQQGA